MEISKELMNQLMANPDVATKLDKFILYRCDPGGFWEQIKSGSLAEINELLVTDVLDYDEKEFYQIKRNEINDFVIDYDHEIMWVMFKNDDSSEMAFVPAEMAKLTDFKDKDKDRDIYEYPW